LLITDYWAYSTSGHIFTQSTQSIKRLFKQILSRKPLLDMLNQSRQCGGTLDHPVSRFVCTGIGIQVSPLLPATQDDPASKGVAGIAAAARLLLTGNASFISRS
jgi:hypothetical protein